MTHEEREAVLALIAALPKCETYLPGFDGDRCGRPATRYDDPCGDTGKGRDPREHYCDQHGAFLTGELDYAPALRRLQAMLEPEEIAASEPKPGGLALTDVADAVLQDRGCRSIGFSHDARLGCRVVEVNMGPILGVARIPFDGTETTAELVEKVRAALPKEWRYIT